MTDRFFGALLLAIMGAIVLAACGGGGGNSSQIDDGECPQGLLEGRSDPVTITFWHSMTANNEETITQLAGDFNASQDQVRVNLIFQGSYSEALDKYVTALRGGDLPQLVQLEDTATQLLIDSNSMTAAQDCLDAGVLDVSDELERIVAFYSVEGKLWPIPFNVSNPVLYYNETAFSEAGLDPADPPTTFEELRQYSQEIVDAGAAEHGIAIELSPWLIEQWFGLGNETYLNNGNGRDARATEAFFDNDLGLEIFTFLDDMVSDGLALNVGRNPSGADHLLAIGSGSAAMAIGTSAALGSVYAVLESGQFPDVKVGVGVLPGPSRDGGILVGGAALWIPNSGSPEEQEAARLFAQWLTEPEQQAVWHEGSGYIPIVKAATELQQVQDLWAELPAYRVAYDQLLEGQLTTATAGPVMGPAEEVREAITQAMERMLLQGQSPEDALQQAAEDADGALADYNDRIGE